MFLTFPMSSVAIWRTDQSRTGPRGTGNMVEDWIRGRYIFNEKTGTCVGDCKSYLNVGGLVLN